jgi:hypothetical protein
VKVHPSSLNDPIIRDFSYTSFDSSKIFELSHDSRYHGCRVTTRGC